MSCDAYACSSWGAVVLLDSDSESWWFRSTHFNVIQQVWTRDDCKVNYYWLCILCWQFHAASLPRLQSSSKNLLATELVAILQDIYILCDNQVISYCHVTRSFTRQTYVRHSNVHLDVRSCCSNVRMNVRRQSVLLLLFVCHRSVFLQPIRYIRGTPWPSYRVTSWSKIRSYRRMHTCTHDWSRKLAMRYNVPLVSHSASNALSGLIQLSTPCTFVNPHLKFIVNGFGFYAPFLRAFPFIAYLCRDHSGRTVLRNLMNRNTTIVCGTRRRCTNISNSLHWRPSDTKINANIKHSDINRNIKQNCDATARVLTTLTIQHLATFVPESKGTQLYLKGHMNHFEITSLVHHQQ